MSPPPRRTWALPSPLGDSSSLSRCNLETVGKAKGGINQLLANLLFLSGLLSAQDDPRLGEMCWEMRGCRGKEPMEMWREDVQDVSPSRLS